MGCSQHGRAKQERRGEEELTVYNVKEGGGIVAISAAFFHASLDRTTQDVSEFQWKSILAVLFVTSPAWTRGASNFRMRRGRRAREDIRASAPRQNHLETMETVSAGQDCV